MRVSQVRISFHDFSLLSWCDRLWHSGYASQWSSRKNQHIIQGNESLKRSAKKSLNRLCKWKAYIWNQVNQSTFKHITSVENNSNLSPECKNKAEKMQNQDTFGLMPKLLQHTKNLTVWLCTTKFWFNIDVEIITNWFYLLPTHSKWQYWISDILGMVWQEIRSPFGPWSQMREIGEYHFQWMAKHTKALSVSGTTIFAT